MRKTLLCLCLLLAGLGICGRAAAGGYPERPIRIVVPFPPGGPDDIVARIVAPKLAEQLHQGVTVDNRSGRDGITGTAEVAAAAPDGYTLLLTPSSHVFHPGTYASMPFDTEKAFAPVSLLVQAQYVLVVSPPLPVDSLAGLIAYAKSHPDRLSYASAGLGGPSQMGFELFKIASGTNFIHKPDAGGAAGLAAVASDAAQAMLAPLVSAVPMIRADKVNALAVSGQRRSLALPDLPTIAETLPGYSFYTWYGLLAPAGTPAAVIARVNAACDDIVHEADVAARLAAIGGEPVGGPAGWLAALIHEEIPKWRRVAREAGIRIE